MGNVRQRARRARQPYCEIAHRAYQLYKEEPPLEFSKRRVGFYSFLKLMSHHTNRYELLPYLEGALLDLT